MATDNRNGHGDATSGSGSGGTTLVMDKLAAVHSPALRVCAMAQMQSCAEPGPVGILVLSGPVARVSRISALVGLAVLIRMADSRGRRCPAAAQVGAGAARAVTC